MRQSKINFVFRFIYYIILNNPSNPSHETIVRTPVINKIFKIVIEVI